MLGELTHYKKVTTTFPNASNANSWEAGANISVSFKPKLVVFYGGDSTASGNIYKGVFALDMDENNVRTGGVYYKHSSTGNLAPGGYNYNTTAGNQRFRYEDGVFSVARFSTTGWWSNTDEYTFEFYG